MYITENNNSNGNDDNNNTYKTSTTKNKKINDNYYLLHYQYYHHYQECSHNYNHYHFFKISNGNTCRTEWSPIQSVITPAFKKITRPFDLIITSTLTDNQFCDWWIWLSWPNMIGCLNCLNTGVRLHNVQPTTPLRCPITTLHNN